MTIIEVGKKIRSFRIIRNLRQIDLAISANVTKQSISKIEAGKQATPIIKLYKIADKLSVDIYDLLPRVRFIRWKGN